MFGLSFGELVVVIIVAIAVIGPKDMPRVLRMAGQWAGRLRRMAADLRVQSGVDDILREGSIRQDIEEIRKLARGELDGVSRDMRLDFSSPAPTNGLGPGAGALAPAPIGGSPDVVFDREREYPRDGADTYGSLPDTAIVYDGSFPPSKWAKDEVYMIGVTFPAEDAPVAAVVETADAAPADPADPTNASSASETAAPADASREGDSA